MFSESPGHHGAAVAIVKGAEGQRGLARLVQLAPERCVVEATIDGLAPGEEHSVSIHEYGDLSAGFDRSGLRAHLTYTFVYFI